ncbi:uncharacterized protein LOC113871537 [Abrus precatorius]|uniref:Uncharacterized protein LOC113871537 n=1 Tax=Abrus precatorius TaxID=3816 RepID=A0A8B8M6Y0_ABRPR|nr:uncharacterized protein LOC113871537 [Abrus precatorius]
MTVGEYAAKFQELMKYWPYYQHDLPILVSKSRIFEANSKGKTVDTRGASPVRHDRRPPRFSKGPYSGSNSSQPEGVPLKRGVARVAQEWAAKRGDSASTAQRLELRGSTGPSTGQKPSIPGRVFAMSGAEASQSEEMIRGKCIIKGRLLDVLFDSGVMHSFISVDCMKSLNLYVTELSCNVVVTTPIGDRYLGSDDDLDFEDLAEIESWYEVDE